MPGTCHLFSVDHSVGHARVIWVDDEWHFIVCQIADELFVEEESASEQAVYGF